MATFSIIVPVYKAENYIRQCIESILLQTFTDFEVLCVDDCGGDNSIHIVEEYAKNDDRIKIFYHSKNLGVAAARNLALENASGKYIFNVDSDDWIAKNTLSILYYHFSNSGAESIWFDGYRYYPLGDRLDDKPIHDRKRVGFIDLYPEVLPTFSDMCGMKAYTVESIKRIGLKWPTDIKFDEDGEFYFKYYCHYPRVYSINNCLYYYRKHEESSGASYGRGENSHIVDSYKVIEHLKEYYQEHGFYDFYKITLLKLIENRVKFCKNANFSKKNVDATMEFYKNINFPEDYVDYEKEKEPLVSIVVPFYNVELYIEQCLTSLIEQTYKNIEILCIDDCGQDNSVEIVKKYAKEDSRVKLIRHKKNKGLGGARNTGLKKANGEYILFIDSDDWVETNCVYEVVSKMNSTRVNSVWFKADFWMDEQNCKKPMEFCSYYMNMKEGYLLLDGNNIASFPLMTCNKAYRTDFLKKNKLGWREKVIYEDVEFYWHMFTKSPIIYIIDKHLYYYRQRATSIMNAPAKGIEKAQTAFLVVSEVAEYLKKHSIFEKYKPAYMKYVENVFSLFKWNVGHMREYKLAQLDFIKKIGL